MREHFKGGIVELQVYTETGFRVIQVEITLLESVPFQL